MSTKVCVAEDCDSTEFDVEDGTYYCMECGEEINESDFATEGSGNGSDPYHNIVVGVVDTVEKVPKSEKLLKLSINVGKDEPVTIVTNSFVKNNDRIIVALENAVLGGGDDQITVKKISVGGVMSYGVVCEASMINWKGGKKGACCKVPDSFKAGDKCPSTKPRTG